MDPSPSRRRQMLAHRKRFSLSRLSSDTTATLPEYTPQFTRSVPALPLPEEDPPGYSADDANEADEDTESDAPTPLSPRLRRAPRHSHHRSSDSQSRSRRHQTPSSSSTLSPLVLSPTFGPRRSRSRSPTPSRSASPSDPHLDALLARSVHALELSNSLLQSSMSTQTSLAALLSTDAPTSMADSALEARARGLDARIRVNSTTHAGWMDGLQDIERAMSSFLDPHPEADRMAAASLPAQDLSPLRQRLRTHTRHRSSTDLRLVTGQPQVLPSLSIDEIPPPVGELQLSRGQMPRARLISPAPRALTQYIDADTRDDADASPLLLPSTIGLRASSSTHPSPIPSHPHPHPAFARSPTLVPPSPHRARFSSPSRRASSANPSAGSSPVKPASDPSSAVNLLASFLSRRPSASASTKPPASSRPSRRRASFSSLPSPSDVPSTALVPPAPIPVHYHYHHPLPGFDPTPHSRRSKTPSTPSSSHTVVRPSRSPTPTRPSRTRTRSPPPPLLLRPMTPPIEVSSASASASSSASNSPSSDPHPNPVLSMQALRKILTEQPPPEPKPRRGLQPRTPAAPTLGTSHATASVSRLFTRGTHLHAAHADEGEGRRSALKRADASSAPPTPGTSTSTPAPAAPPTPPSSASFLRLPLGGGGSASSSGRSTPKRISFAALPESYAGETGERRGAARARSRRKGKGREGGGSGSDSAGGEGWWVGWLLGANRGGSVGANAVGRSERAGKPWGRGLGGMEDWTM